MNESHGHFVDEIHGAADQHHRHYHLEQLIGGLREDLNRALERIAALEAEHDYRDVPDAPDVDAAGREEPPGADDVCPRCRIAVIWSQTPLGQPQCCRCGYIDDEPIEPEPAEVYSGPEVDDERGWSEYHREELSCEQEVPS